MNLFNILKKKLEIIKKSYHLVEMRGKKEKNQKLITSFEKRMFF